MAQTCNDKPKPTPRQASACCGPLDERLNVELFRALGDPTRLNLFACLTKCERPCTVSELAECCVVDYSVVSRHLTTLERAGLVTATKSGRTVWYEVRYRHLAQVFRGLAKAIDSHRPTPASRKGASTAPQATGKTT